MTTLSIFSTAHPGVAMRTITVAGEIAECLGQHGVDFGRWRATAVLADDAGQEDVLAAYADDVARLAELGYTTVDVARMAPDPAAYGFAELVAGARSKFLAEHTHADDEVRFFVEGCGAFYLHLGDEVLAMVCEAGDFLSVPAGTLHWFDMGTAPRFTAIRFFRDPEGWVGSFTGSEIASAFPTFDELTGRAA